MRTVPALLPAAFISAPAPSNAPPPVDFGEALRFWLKLGFIGFGGPAGQLAPIAAAAAIALFRFKAGVMPLLATCRSRSRPRSPAALPPGRRVRRQPAAGRSGLAG